MTCLPTGSIFPFFNLPLEIQEYILNFVKEEKDILTLRKVCINLYNFYRDVPVYCEGFQIGQYNFCSDNFNYKDMEGNLIAILEFAPYGQWKYTEYSPNGFLVRTVRNKKIFQSEMVDYTRQDYNRLLNCDARYGVINEKKISKMIYPGNCIVS